MGRIVAILEGYRPNYSFKIVRWYPPPENWLKCNIDDASRGNRGLAQQPSTLETMMEIWLWPRDTLYKKLQSCGAEAGAIRESLQFYKEK